MSILDEARADAKEILLTGGFETDLKFTSPTDVVIETKGVAIRRTDTLEFDDGKKEYTPYSSLLVPYDSFGFTKNYVSLKNWDVEFTDSEKLRKYKCSESLPNRTLGIITISLKDE